MFALRVLLLAAQVQALVPTDGPHTFAPEIRRLCPTASPDNYRALIALESTLADSATSKSAAPGVWSGLACARALLAASGAPAREGTLMPLGTSWARGTIDVLLRALAVAPDDARMLDLVAAFALHPSSVTLAPGAMVLDDFGEALHRAVENGDRSPPVLRACTRLLVMTGDVATARDCSSRALQGGIDSTWHWLRLARLTFADGDTSGGASLFERAAISAHDSVSVNELLYPFFVRAAWQPWIAVAPPERRRWIRDSLFPAAPDDSEPVPFPRHVAQQFRTTSDGGATSAYWSCMQQFTADCPTIGVRGERILWTAARFQQLWDNTTEAPIALVTYGVRLDDLALVTNGTQRSADVTIDIRTWNAAATLWTDSLVRRQLRLPGSAPGHAFATGFVLIPTSPGVTSWSLQARQSATRRGRAFDDRHLPLGDGALLLSDLLLGGPRQGLEWLYAGRRLFVSALGHLRRSEPVQLFYQLLSDRDRPRVKATIRVHRLDGDSADEASVLKVSYDVAAHRGVSDLSLQLDLSRFAPGTYAMELVIADGVDGIAMRRATTLILD